MIRVHDDGDAVVRGHGAHVKGEGDGSGGARVLVLDRLAGNELCPSIGSLDHDGRVVFSRGLHDCVGSGRTAEGNET